MTPAAPPGADSVIFRIVPAALKCRFEVDSGPIGADGATSVSQIGRKCGRGRNGEIPFTPMRSAPFKPAPLLLLSSLPSPSLIELDAVEAFLSVAGVAR